MSKPSEALSDNIISIINHHIEGWIHIIATDFNVSPDTLMEKWSLYMDGHSKQRKSTPAYVQFCNEQRPLLKKSHPNMSFGEQAKHLGQIWRNLSTEEREKYSKPITPPPQKSNNNFSSTELQKKTLNELKELCGSLSIKRTGNKDTIINRIISHKTTTDDVSPPPSTENELIFYENIEDEDSSSITSSSSGSFIIDDDDQSLDDFDS